MSPAGGITIYEGTYQENDSSLTGAGFLERYNCDKKMKQMTENEKYCQYCYKRKKHGK